MKNKQLPLDTKIEVVAIKKSNRDKVHSKIMELRNWYKMERSKEYEYHAYEIGFSSYKKNKKK